MINLGIEIKSMKNIALLILPVILFFACDKVENPNQNPDAVTDCTVNPHFVKSNLTKMNFRKVLVEDYTGHTCGNCPRAAENATTIVNRHGDSVVVIAVHAGTQFAPPVPPNYPEDFRTPAGTDWDNFLGMSAAGLPKGCVNRSQTPYPQPRTTWSVTVDALLNNPQDAKMLVTTTLDTTQLLLNVEVKTTFLKAFTDDVFLSVVITEDSIIGAQKDYSPPVGATVINGDERPDYNFEHTLRGAVNGSWGDEIKKAPIAINDTVTKTYKCFKLNPWPVKPSNPKYNLKHMSVVVFIYKASNKEVIQVEKVHIM